LRGRRRRRKRIAEGKGGMEKGWLGVLEEVGSRRVGK